jgi:hypothetical protein
MNRLDRLNDALVTIKHAKALFKLQDALVTMEQHKSFVQT